MASATSDDEGDEEWLFDEEDLKRSPSAADGISWSEENELRRKTCIYIRSLCTQLSLAMLPTATAQVFFHRFFIRQSFREFHRHLVATACVFLASKVEESPRRLNALVDLYFVRQTRSILSDNAHPG